MNALCLCVCVFTSSSIVGVRFSGAEVIGSYELPDTDAGN